MYLIGEMINGCIEENWFVYVPLNSTISVTLRINGIEEVELSSEQKKYTLLILKEEDPSGLNLLFGLNIGHEILDIYIEGDD